MPSAKLIVKEGPLAGQRLELEHEVVVGRANADITIGDPELSRRHAVLRPGEHALEIEDLGSLNGTWVNGRRIETTTLAPGDLVKIGDSVLQVEDVPSQAQPTRISAAPRVAETVVAPAAPAPAPVPAPPAAPAAQPAPAPSAASVSPPAAPFAAPAPRRRRRVATRLAGAAFLSIAAVIATAVALIVYFAQH
jgi:hypothetical protein